MNDVRLNRDDLTKKSKQAFIISSHLAVSCTKTLFVLCTSLHDFLWLLFLSVNLILVPAVPPFPTYLFVHPSLLPLLIHQSPLCSSVTLSYFHSRLKTYLFTNSIPVVSLLPPGLPSRIIPWTVSSELLGFCF